MSIIKIIKKKGGGEEKQEKQEQQEKGEGISREREDKESKIEETKIEDLKSGKKEDRWIEDRWEKSGRGKFREKFGEKFKPKFSQHLEEKRGWQRVSGPVGEAERKEIEEEKIQEKVYQERKEQRLGKEDQSQKKNIQGEEREERGKIEGSEYLNLKHRQFQPKHKFKEIKRKEKLGRETDKEAYGNRGVGESSGGVSGYKVDEKLKAEEERRAGEKHRAPEKFKTSDKHRVADERRARKFPEYLVRKTEKKIEEKVEGESSRGDDSWKDRSESRLKDAESRLKYEDITSASRELRREEKERRKGGEREEGWEKEREKGKDKEKEKGERGEKLEGGRAQRERDEGRRDEGGMEPVGVRFEKLSEEKIKEIGDSEATEGVIEGTGISDVDKVEDKFEFGWSDRGEDGGRGAVFEGSGFEELEFYSAREDIIPFRVRSFFKRRKWKKDKGRRFDEERVYVERPISPQPKKLKIKIPEAITVAELSKLTGIKSSEIIAKLLQLGKEVTINQFISADDAELICADFGIEVERVEFDESVYFDLSPDPEDKMKPRPPVVVVMGHVDHGKTTLLDSIRHTNVAEKEAGGITQSIGAYTVDVDGRFITFIDTPGHEAFTEMRARGAKVADIAVLVVAADEGVKPQTEEAIAHARAAELPIVVAINKIDKPGANPELVRSQLSKLGLIPEEWGGDTLYAEISAKKRIGVDILLEKILLQADILGLRANPDRLAEGVIIESSVDKGLGAVATVILQRGTLRKGDIFVSGLIWGRVRNIFSDRGKIIKEVLPGYPARIVIGGADVPSAGDKLYVVKDENIASKIVEERRKRQLSRTSISLEDIFEKISSSSENKVILPIVLKASSDGALDALEKEILAIQHPQLDIKIIHKGIGVISQSDVNLASASRGLIIGYGVNFDRQAQNLAKMLGVEVRVYKIIYEIVDDIKKAIRGMLKPTEREVIIGSAKVLKIFKLSVGRVYGCVVQSGKIQLGLNARVRRNGDIIGEGKVSSLKRFKDAVDEVKEGEECGILLEGVKDILENDIIECYKVEREEVSI